MKREIKFRTWNKETKKFESFFGHSEVALNSMFESEVFEIQQYTGLKDKNGKEIYEGDLIIIEGETFSHLDEVRIYRGHVCVGVSPLWPEYEMEIVGNVFETPALRSYARA